MAAHRAAPRLPLWLKLTYTGFVAVLVPFYWAAYGPTNFLYFCDVALLLTVAAVWCESALLASAALIGIFLPQMLWVVDFLGTLVGLPVAHMTDYMFDADLSLFARFLSFFHFWLPFFLLGLVARLGYDRRALPLWTVLAWVLLCVCYFFMPGPPGPGDDPSMPANINYVYGFAERGQTWMAPDLYFVLMLAGMPVLIFLPSHLICAALFGRPAAGARGEAAPDVVPSGPSAAAMGASAGSPP